MVISDYFAKTYIINLPARSDRRRETNAMLKRVGLATGSGGIEYFPATRPDSAGDFASIGTRGCFLSHLGALKKARDEGAANVLLMEDDLEIDPKFSNLTDAFVSTLRKEPWGFVYFGHRLTDVPPSPGGELLIPYRGPIVTAHFVGINGTVLPRLIDFLDTVLGRPGGHPDGGPMHVDGAYSTFRQQNPDVLTLVAQPSLGWQRSSKSDITTAWFDSVPGLNVLSGLARIMKGKGRKLDATK
ncbi:glycosyltransferase family 25 protein [Paludisphaera borealis]|uniref:GT25 family glycosyltransferase n=1 Tax=Paludisphaera borealis TaxID=1387353 RepID=A0A1U7CIH0_9BACT|nr:LPS biosynthesis glycosyltransferase [Paludisphaera borealis]APW58732.1 GT25 family glycosyltransferase [Paludisphaera borealis]